MTKMKKHRIYVSDGFNLDGSRRRFSKTVETDLTGRDLERFLTLQRYDFEDEIKKKDPKFNNLSRGSFEGYSIWWLYYIKVSARTKKEYEKLLNNRINKYIGRKVLEKLTTNDMIELMKLIEESPAKTKSGKLSSTYVNHHHRLLKIMFNDAVKLKIIDESPMEHVPTAVKKTKLKGNYYDVDDVRKLLELLPHEPVKYQLLTLLALSTGARLGEITGLQWKHIDLHKKEIKIEQANTYVEREGSSIKSTKNEHSERTIAIPGNLVNLFEKHKENEILKKELLGDQWYYGENKDEDDFVFTQNNGKIIFVSTPSSWFNKFIKKHDLKKITFHGLRHTTTTILINSGINVVSISHSLGHSKTSTTTDFYAHHLQSVERKMADTFDDILESGTGSGTQETKLRVVK